MVVVSPTSRTSIGIMVSLRWCFFLLAVLPRDMGKLESWMLLDALRRA